MGEVLDRSLAEFERALDDYTDRFVPEEVTKLHRKIALEALQRVVQKTPVDTGRARGNWQITIGVLATGERLSADPLADAVAELTGLEAFEIVWITNNVPYISVLEEGGYPDPPAGGEGKTIGGFSVQAPVGMVAVTIEEITQRFP